MSGDKQVGRLYQYTPSGLLYLVLDKSSDSLDRYRAFRFDTMSISNSNWVINEKDLELYLSKEYT